MTWCIEEQPCPASLRKWQHRLTGLWTKGLRVCDHRKWSILYGKKGYILMQSRVSFLALILLDWCTSILMSFRFTRQMASAIITSNVTLVYPHHDSGQVLCCRIGSTGGSARFNILSCMHNWEFSLKWTKLHTKIGAQAKFYMHRANSTCICTYKSP